jgi:hypothetical protein
MFLVPTFCDIVKNGPYILKKVKKKSIIFSVIKNGFPYTCMNWMKMCVTDVEYHILMNDDQVGTVIPERDLRQGDPLSP